MSYVMKKRPLKIPAQNQEVALKKLLLSLRRW